MIIVINGDIDNIKWSLIKTKNNIRERYDHGMIYYDNKIYIICGYNKDGYMNDIHYLELKKNKFMWKRLHINNVPKMSTFSCDLYTDNALIFGGYDYNGCSNDLYSLDILNKKFNKVKVNYNNITLHKRAYHSSCIYDNKLFIFGGCEDEFYNFQDNNIYYFDLLNNIPSLYYIETDLPYLQVHSMTCNANKLNKPHTLIDGFIREISYNVPTEIVQLIYLFLKDTTSICIVGGVTSDNDISNESILIKNITTESNVVEYESMEIVGLPYCLSGSDTCCIGNNIVIFGGATDFGLHEQTNDVLYLSLE